MSAISTSRPQRADEASTGGSTSFGERVTELRPRSRNPALPSVEPSVAEVRDFVAEASGLIAAAVDEVTRVKAAAAEGAHRMRMEIEETSRILRLTEEQLANFERRLDETSREVDLLRIRLQEEELARAELVRASEADRRKAALLEGILTDAKERVATAERRAEEAEGRAVAFESQLQALIGKLREQFAFDKDQRRGLGALTVMMGFLAAIVWAIFAPTGGAVAGVAPRLDGVWAAECSRPSVVITPSSIEFRRDLVGRVDGRFSADDVNVTFRGDGVEVRLSTVGDDAIVLRSVRLGALELAVAQPILVRCSLVAPAGSV